MIKRLRWRFIRIAMISISSVMLVFCLIVNIANLVSVNSDLDDMLRMIAENEGTIPQMPHGDPNGGDMAPENPPNGKFTPETPYSTRFFVLRYTSDGTLVLADLDKIAAVDESDADKYLDIALAHSEGIHYTDGYRYLVKDDGDGRYMAIFLDCHDEMKNVMTTLILSSAAAVVCIGIVYFVVQLFSRRAIDPVVRASEKQKQFITDASHELKTPITVIATCLTVLEMETGKQKWIDKARAQNEKLKSLVESLVTLSRMDEDESPLKFEHFSASGAISETAESFREFAKSAGHELHVTVEPDIDYLGDEYAVRQLVSILLDNAVKYATPDTPIEFLLARARHGIVITVKNKCDGMDPAETAKLFDRFYRPDKSRTSSTGGFGIGLSIARSIAEGHRGSITASVTDKDTIVFSAELK